MCATVILIAQPARFKLDTLGPSAFVAQKRNPVPVIAELKTCGEGAQALDHLPRRLPLTSNSLGIGTRVCLCVSVFGERGEKERERGERERGVHADGYEEKRDDASLH